MNVRHEFIVQLSPQVIYRQVAPNNGGSVPEEVWRAATDRGIMRFPPGSVRYTGTSVKCSKCGQWYNTWVQTTVCPHIDYNLPKPSLPIEDELLIRKEGYIFARAVESRGIEPMEAVNSCPYGEAYPNNDNLKAHAWYAGWWFYWYIMKRWIDVALGVEE